ncbi:MAG: Na(+)-translocating NADH-quinone reductase subunit A [Gammaproteobacteria bacterium]|nr:Na(+)-translocating NADH-quinone reductase subunit A [Gammaproteobacteria bacterium]
MIKIRKGLDLPVTGGPQQVIEDRSVTRIAVLGSDYVDVKPVVQVEEGTRVKRGQLLFTDKKLPGVNFTTPAGGVVRAIHRGEKRSLLSLIIDVDASEDSLVFKSYSRNELRQLSGIQVRENLLQSGLWTCLRTRPYNKVPAADSMPHSIFVTAMDSNPLAADPSVVIQGQGQSFLDGLNVLSVLSVGKLFVCHESGADIPHSDNPSVVTETFSGPHPEGLVGTHIHFLDPVSLHKTVWHVNYQDVIAIGHLFINGELDVQRVISLAGSQVERPRLLRTRIGASIEQLTVEKLFSDEHRVISGSILCGRQVTEEIAYLGRYHHQVSVLPEEHEQELLGWLKPGWNKFSIFNLFSSAFRRHKNFTFTTSSGGEARPMVPIGTYEAVMPLDILPTPLLRALIVGDTDTALALGALELDEEDLALCTFVCPGKYDYGPLLRDVLRRIEKEF